ncbi:MULTISPECIES: hypothetical protein [Caulobacter]|nr:MULTISPECIES: hypothetical protein [Caulobacter]
MRLAPQDEELSIGIPHPEAPVKRASKDARRPTNPSLPAQSPV